ncbi:MAG: CarD family transcriptional regulator [Alphaproteobacteria bacterium]|nr:CarD family transcriptional regulator [Alphaproteobacteria bacterium]
MAKATPKKSDKPARKAAPKGKAKAAPTKSSAPKKPAAAKATKPAKAPAKAKAKAPAKAAAKAPAKAKAAPKAKVKAAPKAASKAPAKKPTAKKAAIKAAPKVAAKSAPAKKPAPETPKSGPATADTAAGAAAPKRKAPAPSKAPAKLLYKVGDYVVYPSHGVGQITGVEDHEIGEISLKVYVVLFDKEKMTLRVPIGKTLSSGMRRLSSQAKMDTAVATLRGKARQRRVMWSRRAQEYEAKLNSGDPVGIAEVIRDLHRNAGQPDQSYSERQMYEAALERLAREFAAVENTDSETATARLEEVLRADAGE